MTLYAIVGEKPRRPLGKGASGRALSLLRVAAAYVVVERAPAPAASPATIRAHDRIVRRLASGSASVLPFRFGSAVSDERALAEALAPVAAAIERALQLVHGCVQYTIRVFGEAAPAPKPAKDAGPGTRWLGARVAARRVPEIAGVTEATRPFVRASKTTRHDRPPLVASVYHLVPREDAARYRAALAASARGLRGVELKTSGPWPAYAFAELV